MGASRQFFLEIDVLRGLRGKCLLLLEAVVYQENHRINWKKEGGFETLEEEKNCIIKDNLYSSSKITQVDH